MSENATSPKPKADRRPRPVRAGQQLVTLAQASASRGIPYTTLRDLGLRGHLPIVRLPDCARWFVRLSDLDALIARSVDTDLLMASEGR
jgi:hypothetical protein